MDETPVVDEPEVDEPVVEGEGEGSISGLKFNDINNSGFRDSELVQGENPDVVFIIDASGSTSSSFTGSPVGDLNGDGTPDDIVDAELAGFLALNQQLINLGLGDSVDVALVAFGSNATQIESKS